MPSSERARATGAPAVLYWFYDSPDISANHLRLARLGAPGVQYFGLYGGTRPLDQFRGVTELLDNVWSHPPVDPNWAWRNGDLMLARWFRERGAGLDWDALLVHQWDLVLAHDARSVVDMLGDAQVCLPGVRPLPEVRESWVWVQPWSHYRAEFDAFLAATAIDEADVRCCVFVYGVFTKAFFAAYAVTAAGLPGFVEYRLPTLAALLGFDVADSGDEPFWNGALGGDELLNGSGHVVDVSEMRASTRRRVAWHPVHVTLSDRELLDLRHAGTLRGSASTPEAV